MKKIKLLAPAIALTLMSPNVWSGYGHDKVTGQAAEVETTTQTTKTKTETDINTADRNMQQNKAYQTDRGMQEEEEEEADGINSRMAATTKPHAETALSHQEIKDAQMSLKERGLYEGPVDGVVGAKTQAALREYQTNNSMERTGTLDRNTFDSLTATNTRNRTQTYSE